MKILLVRTGGLGDSILTLPVANCLKKIDNSIELHILGNETMLAVARLSGIFDGFRSIDESGFSALYSSSKASDFLQKYFSSFDEVYFFTAGNKKQIIRKVTDSGAGKCFVLDPRPPEDWHNHIIEHFLSIIDGKKILSPCKLDNYGVTLGSVSKSNRRGLVIHPGSGSNSKNWPIERDIYIAEKSKMNVTFILGPAECELGLDKDITESCFKNINPESISDLCSLLCGASFYIGNDSGVSHLAALCETQSVVLFGPTDPVIWRPLGSDVNVISSPDGTINGISADEVVKKIKKRKL